MKEAILAAAAEEIRLHGSSFRMEDLARRLNISKRTLYENFRSKNEILEKIISEKAQDFYEQHKEILRDTSISCEEKLKKYFAVKSDLYETLNGDHFREMFNSIPYLVEQAMDIFDRDWKLLQAYLEEQKQNKVIKDIDIDVLILMLRGIVRFIMYDSNRNPDECLKILPESIDILLSGILNEGADNV